MESFSSSVSQSSTILYSALFLSMAITIASGNNHNTSPLSFSLPLPVSNIPQPVTLNKNANINSNDVIGYIVVPYPGIDHRNDNSPNPQLINLLNSANSHINNNGGGTFSSIRRALTPNFARSPLMPPPMMPMYNPLAAYGGLGLGAFPGYGIYGFNPRIPMYNYFG